jgi:hypothetical protein
LYKILGRNLQQKGDLDDLGVDNIKIYLEYGVWIGFMWLRISIEIPFCVHEILQRTVLNTAMNTTFPQSARFLD